MNEIAAFVLCAQTAEFGQKHQYLACDSEEKASLPDGVNVGLLSKKPYRLKGCLGIAALSEIDTI